MAINFGETWWGKAWLGALEKMDHSNRLPRGASYARAGHVEKISIRGNSVTAKVLGLSRYTVRMTFAQFPHYAINLFVNELLKRPLLVSKLLSRELDPSVAEIARQCKLKLFPTLWRELDATCTCPDYANPCKHTAAVIYVLSKEIDQNPFLIFTLHGFDLLQELSDRGLSNSIESALEVPLLKDYFAFGPIKRSKEALPALENIDLSHLRDISQRLVSILGEPPAFMAAAGFLPKYIKLQEVVTLRAKAMIDSLGEEALMASDAKPSAMSFITRLLSIPESKIADCNKDTYLARLAAKVALYILSNGAAIPQIVRTNKVQYGIIWVPAMIDANVSVVVQKLNELLPPDFTTIKSMLRRLAPANAAFYLLSSNISALVFGICGESEKKIYDKILGMFFLGKQQTFSTMVEKENPGSIKSWLDIYSISTGRYLPVLFVDENPGEEHFHISIDIDDSISGKRLHLQDILTDKNLTRRQCQVLSALSPYGKWIPKYLEYVDDRCEESIKLDNGEMAKFLLEAVPVLHTMGAKVILPKSLHDLVRPKVKVEVSRDAQKDRVTHCSIDDLLKFDLKVAIGDEVITKEEFEKLNLNADKLIHFKKNYIYLNSSDLATLRRQLSGDGDMSGNVKLQTILTGEYEDIPIQLSEEAKSLLRSIKETDEVDIPQDVKATLRPYQKRGYEWLWKNFRIGFGCILADDMGLGKTLQTITFIQKLKDEGLLKKKKVIIIVPKGLITGWQSEINRFTPDLTVHTYHGSGRSMLLFDSDILLTTYGVLRSDIEAISKYKWVAAIIDEAQNIKNADTEQSKAARRLKADIHIALSGTPVENRLSEYWTIMDFANKGYLGSAKKFQSQFALPIQRDGNEDALRQFKLVTSPFIMRRLKSDKSIIDDLPDKIEQNEYPEMVPQQAVLYRKVVDEGFKALDEFEAKEGMNDNEALFKRSSLILQMILALKQICNHPVQYLKDGPLDPSASGKTEMLLDMVESIDNAREKVLIFTQFRQMGDILSQLITQRLGVEPLFLHGGCSIAQRKKMVDRFQENPADRIFILSLKAAGTGLNLTAASHVIHFDLWWNPAVEAQATDRAYRIGQHKNVLVHRFITKGTFEEKIDKMISDKKYLAQMTVSTGENWIGNLSDEELRSIFE